MGLGGRQVQSRVRVVGRGSGRASRWPAIPATLLAVAVLAGCGLRVGSQQVHAATEAAMGAGTGGGGAGLLAGGSTQSASQLPGSSSGPAGGPDTTLAGGGVSSGGTGGGSTGPGGTGAQGSTSATTPGGGGGAACTGDNGGSTDTGVTGSTISVGNVSDLSGPVPGLFQGGPYGTQAYFDYINSQGGVCGRKLKLVSSDDALTCNQNEADYQNLVGSVFAFVGSWSLDDSCGAQVMKAHPTVPIVSQSLSTDMQNLPNSYSEQPYEAGGQTGYFLYLKQKYPDAITSVGTIVGNQPAAVASWRYYKNAMQSLGYQVKYEDDVPPAQTNFTADIIRMRSDGIKMVFLIALNAPDVADVSQEAQQQGWKPEVFVSPVAYFGQYISASGGASAVEGQWVPAATAMFLGEDASVLPEVANFQHWIRTAYPSFPIDQFAAASWANAALFVHALQTVGPKLTRQAVLQALSQIHIWNDYGMMPPTDIGSKAPATCYLLLQIHNGTYVKVDDPPGGPTDEFRCDGSFVRYG